jgi:two-component system chemotaxis response regulator CheY
MRGKQVLSIGQCYADHSAIAGTLERHFEAIVVPAATAAEALNFLRQRAFDLVLVNRVLDADGSSGVAIVEQFKAHERLQDVPVMLVSNYEDAQQQAVEKGALPGFGKASLGQPHMLARVKAVLAGAGDAMKK